MSHYLIVTPEGQDYLRSSEIFQNLTYNTKAVTLDSKMSATVTPFAALDGSGRAMLQSNLLVNSASVSANMPLFTLPTKLVAQHDCYFPVVVLRSGAYVANAIKITASTGVATLITQPQQNDVVYLDSVQFLVNSYK